MILHTSSWLERCRHRSLVALAVMLAAHAALLAWGAAIHSPAWDEVGHMAAGISHWRSGCFDLYRVNPPLVRLVATLPVVLAGADIDWDRYNAAPWSRAEFEIGHSFLKAYGPASLWYYTIARWCCIPFSLLGGIVCFVWARDAFGEWSGLAAASLWCFSPNILANAQMITPDTGATALGLLACYTFWTWLRQPSFPRTLALSVFLGLALLSKYTWLILPPLWVLLWLLHALVHRGESTGRRRSREAGHLLLVFVLAFQTVAIGYTFENMLVRLDTFQFVSRTLARLDDPDSGLSGNRFAGTWLGRLPVPLPANYLQGIDVQKSDFESGYWSYMRGEWKRGGWWYYYVYGLLVKEPVGTWCLGILALALAGFDRSRFALRFRDVVLIAPAVAVLFLVSSQTGFNHHLRYILPVLPFAYIGSARVFSVQEVGAPPRLARMAGIAFLGWSVASSLWHVPHSLSYFNELAGGPMNGPWHLHDSNIDWGQDLLLLKRWMDAHPEARPMEIVFHNCYTSGALGIWDRNTSHELTPSPRRSRDSKTGSLGPRWYAITTRTLFDHLTPEERDPFARFRGRKPDAVIGYSIYIFKEEPEPSATESQAAKSAGAASK